MPLFYPKQKLLFIRYIITERQVRLEKHKVLEKYNIVQKKIPGKRFEGDIYDYIWQTG